MTELTPEQVQFNTNAAKEFLQFHPEYELTPGNARILSAEILRLIESGEYDPADVGTFEAAFQNRRNALTLKDLPAPEIPLEETMEYHSREYFRELSPEDKEAFGARLAKLTDRQRDNLPDWLARFYVSYDVRNRSKGVVSEADEILRPLFLSEGFADSSKNRAIVAGWMNKRELGYSLGNLKLALSECAEHLEPSAEAIDRMSAGTYKEKILDPLINKQKAEQAQQRTRERGNPPGFSYVSWLHNQ
jgi:hypothetical protein